MTWADADREAAGLVLRADDLGDGGWRAFAPAAVEGPPVEDGDLGALLTAHLPEEAVTATADSPLFLRPPARLAYSSAVVFGDERAAVKALAVVGSERFAAELAAAVVGDVTAPSGGAELLGSHTRPLDTGAGHPGVEVTAHRTTFGGATADHVVGVHVDLVVLAHGARLLLVWMADAPDPFPDGARDHVLERLALRLVSG